MIGQRIEGYLIEKKLSQGGFGQVYKAVHETLHIDVAIKIVDHSRLQLAKEKAQLEVEVSILENVYHSNIIQFFEYFSSNDQHFIVTELANGGDLHDLVSRTGGLSESEARKIFHQIVAGVEFLHMNGIYHRDLKLENFVLVDSTVKSIDFGLSKRVADEYFELLDTKCGSLQYMDIVQMKKRPGSYAGEVADVWSLGIILYHLLVGSNPFEKCDEVSLLVSAVSTKNYKIPETLSEDAKNLLTHLLEPKISRRISLQEMKCHKWFMNYSPFAYIDSLYFLGHINTPSKRQIEIADPLEEDMDLREDDTDEGIFNMPSIAEFQPIQEQLSNYRLIMSSRNNRRTISKLNAPFEYTFSHLSKLDTEANRKVTSDILQEAFVNPVLDIEWIQGFYIPSSLDFLEKLFEFLDRRTIKINLVSPQEFQFACYLTLKREDHASRFDMCVVSDIDMWVLQVKNVNLPIMQFVSLCVGIDRLCQKELNSN